MIFKSRKFKLWFFLGVLFIFLFGTALHFTYDLSNQNKFVALFSSINESVWEHLKLGLFSTILFSFIDYKFLLGTARNYFFAKFLGIISMMVFIIIGFYTYTGIIGYSILFIDILLFLLGALLNQFVSYKIMINENFKNYNSIGLLGILILIIIFFIFTFFPPSIPLFNPPKHS